MRDVPLAPLGWKLGGGGDVEGASNPFWCASMGEGCPRRLLGTVISNPRSDGLRVNRRWEEKKTILYCVSSILFRSRQKLQIYGTSCRFLIILKAYFVYKIFE